MPDNFVGPTGDTFSIDAYDAGRNMAGAETPLPRITECGGLKENVMDRDVTAHGDVAVNSAPTGVVNLDDITLKGYVSSQATGAPEADSAYAVLGDPPIRPDVPSRTFKITHRTGLVETIEVRVAKNDLIIPPAGGDDLLMFEAVLKNMSRQRTRRGTYTR